MAQGLALFQTTGSDKRGENSPMSVSGLIQEAKKAYENKEYRQAAELFQNVAEQQIFLGDPLMEAEMKNNCSVAWLQAGEPQKSLDVVLGTDQVFAEANDPRRQAMALGNQAAALEALGSLSEAMDKYQTAADIFKDIHEEDLRAYVLKNLSALQLRTGDQLQAIASMHTALENKKKLGLKEKFLKKFLRIPFKMLR
ncbi:MAG: hypothetical protein LLG42_01085 [Chloroflexi bacterium]|nr:hypothetical protein [Chloroflexota bacterium]